MKNKQEIIDWLMSEFSNETEFKKYELSYYRCCIEENKSLNQFINPAWKEAEEYFLDKINQIYKQEEEKKVWHKYDESIEWSQFINLVTGKLQYQFKSNLSDFRINAECDKHTFEDTLETYKRELKLFIETGLTTIYKIDERKIILNK
jgi:hypothetical protein